MILKLLPNMSPDNFIRRESVEYGDLNALLKFTHKIQFDRKAPELSY